MFNTQNNHQALLTTLISRLPTNFTAACEQIRRTIVPHLVGCDDEILAYSIQSIARQTNAPSEEAVGEVIGKCLFTSGGASCSVKNPKSIAALFERWKTPDAGFEKRRPPGTGKTHTTESCLRIQPPTAYHKITSASPKSLYNMGAGLEHKALILFFSWRVKNVDHTSHHFLPL